MKRMLVALALASVAGPLAFSPAHAHTPGFEFAGYQMAYTLGLEADFAGPAGYINVPLQPPHAVNSGAFADDSVASITNRDPIPHTFAECASACDTAAGVPVDPADIERFRFAEISVPPLSSASSADIGKLNASLAKWGPRSYVIMCTIHKWMRAKLTVTG